jgi:hypothetical protein
VALACTASLAGLEAKTITEEDVAAAVTALIAERTKDGVFSLRDPRTDATLALVFDGVRVVRGLKDYGWFPDVIFRDSQMPLKKYAVDFWLKPDGDRLKLMDVHVHKEPRPDGNSWMMITRAPLAWWWLPTLERSSAVVGIEAWQVMGAIHEHIVGARKDGAFALPDADGKPLPLELVEIYQPVGRLNEDGRYFACVEFRKIGSRTAFYAVDFRLDPKTGSVEVGSVSPHENPLADDGKAASEPRCRFEGLAFEVVE